MRMLELPYDMELVKTLSTEAELEDLLGVEAFVGAVNEDEFVDEVEEDSDDDDTIPGLMENIRLVPVEAVIVIDDDGGS